MARPVRPSVPAPELGLLEVRLIGSDRAVRALVAALATAAQCGPASYRPSRYSDATRAYLTIVVPPGADSP